MVQQIQFILTFITTSVRSRLSLQAENAALRNQLSLYRISGHRPKNFASRPAALVFHSEILGGLAHDRRRIVHFNVTEHPTAQWTAQQIVEVFPFDTAPRYLIRDGDGIYGERVTRRIESLGIDEVATAPASPWQNAYMERVIGTLRRELFDHVIMLNERHLKRLMSSYPDYYHPWRAHRSLDRDAPDGRPVQVAKSCNCNVVELSDVHGLYHVYLPQAA